MKFFIYCFVFLLGISNAFAASFDCDKAAHPVEKLICSSSSLSDLDDRLSEAYKNAAKNLQIADQVKADQKLWIKETRACSDELCLVGLYEKRITELNSIKSVVKDGNPSFKGPVTTSKSDVATSENQNGYLPYILTAIIFITGVYFLGRGSKDSENNSNEKNDQSSVKPTDLASLNISSQNKSNTASHGEKLNSCPDLTYRHKPLAGLTESESVREDLDSIEGKLFERGFGVELTGDDDGEIDTLYIHFALLQETPEQDPVSCLITEITTSNPESDEIDADIAEQICYYVEEKATELSVSWSSKQKEIFSNLEDNAIFINGKRLY